MSTSVATCPNGKPDPCDEIRKKIDELINRDKRTPENNGEGTQGLKHRFPEQIYGKNGPGTPVWDNHDKMIREQQKGLQDQLNKLRDNGCGDPPPAAYWWASRPAPYPSDWKGPVTTEDDPHKTARVAAEAAEAAGGAAAAGGAGYLIYRGLRMLPSLLPPLWETIPANLAIP